MFDQQAPVAKAELRYQEFSAPKRKWLYRISNWPTILVYGVVVVYVANIFLSFVLGHAVPPVDRFEHWASHPEEERIFGFVVLWIVILHIKLTFKTLGLSTSSITREREFNNWDLLLLTGIDARTILRGKWWASVQHMWRNYVVLGGLQALMTIWAIGKSDFSMFYTFQLNMNGGETAFRLFGLSVIVTVFVDFISLLNLGLTAACGLLAASDYANKNVALILSIGIRLFTILSITIIPIAIADHLRLHFVMETFRGALGLIILHMLVTLADNGFWVSYFVLFTTPFYAVYDNPNYEGSFQDVPIVFVAMFLSPLVYIAMTRLALHFAERNIIRAGALPPLSSQSRKII